MSAQLVVSQTCPALLSLYWFIQSPNVHWLPTMWQVFAVGTADTAVKQNDKTSCPLWKIAEEEIWFCGSHILLIMNFITVILKLNHPHLTGPHSYKSQTFSCWSILKRIPHNPGVAYFFNNTKLFFFISILGFNQKIIIINFMLSFLVLNLSDFKGCESGYL